VAAASALAAPPDAPKEIQAKPNQIVRIPVKGADVGFTAAFDETVAFFDELAPRDGQRRFIFQAPAPGRYPVVFWTKGETTGTLTTIVVDGQRPDPDPQPDPGPVPQPQPDPMPGPVTSFRVIFIVERMANLTPAQNSVIHGVEVEKFLDDKTTKTDNTRGWRRIDKDAATDLDTPTWNTLWASTKAKLRPQDAPCAAVEVNGKVEIIPLEATPAAMVAKLQSYLGGK
jgi:hypothetical protein